MPLRSTSSLYSSKPLRSTCAAGVPVIHFAPNFSQRSMPGQDGLYGGFADQPPQTPIIRRPRRSARWKYAGMRLSQLRIVNGTASGACCLVTAGDSTANPEYSVTGSPDDCGTPACSS